MHYDLPEEDIRLYTQYISSRNFDDTYRNHQQYYPQLYDALIQSKSHMPYETQRVLINFMSKPIYQDDVYLIISILFYSSMPTCQYQSFMQKLYKNCSPMAIQKCQLFIQWLKTQTSTVFISDSQSITPKNMSTTKQTLAKIYNYIHELRRLHMHSSSSICKQTNEDIFYILYVDHNESHDFMASFIQDLSISEIEECQELMKFIDFNRRSNVELSPSPSSVSSQRCMISL